MFCNIMFMNNVLLKSNNKELLNVMGDYLSHSMKDIQKRYPRLILVSWVHTHAYTERYTQIHTHTYTCTRISTYISKKSAF